MPFGDALWKLKMTVGVPRLIAIGSSSVHVTDTPKLFFNILRFRLRIETRCLGKADLADGPSEYISNPAPFRFWQPRRWDLVPNHGRA